ncbi:MAG: hypothetical protein LBU42_01230, partial [Prevotellaceae bacterium]|nr:hypothetical protein [Prevotellaceae bacterium]
RQNPLLRPPVGKHPGRKRAVEHDEERDNPVDPVAVGSGQWAVANANSLCRKFEKTPVWKHAGGFF